MKASYYLALFVFVSLAHGSETDIFEPDDFLDPRELGAEIQAGGGVTFGGSYRFFDMGAGQVWNYQDRTTFTDEDLAFLSIGYHKYWDDSQINHRITLFENSVNALRYRLKSEYAKYRIRRLSAEGDDAIVYRNKVSVVIDDSGAGDPEFELAGEISFDMPAYPGASIRFRGDFIGSYRRAGGDDIYRVMFNPSTKTYSSGSGLWFASVGFWIGYEWLGSTSRPIPIRANAKIDFQVNPRARLQLFYGPAYQFDTEGFEDRANHEAGLMFYYAFGSSFRQGF